MLHFRYCKGDHEHHQIAGHVRDPETSKSIQLSSFTERYPRKFARQVVACLNREHQKPQWTFVGETSQDDDHPTKRGRLCQKTSIDLINPTWETIMQEANRLAKRVGPSVIQSGPIINSFDSRQGGLSHCPVSRSGSNARPAESNASRRGRSPQDDMHSTKI